MTGGGATTGGGKGGARDAAGGVFGVIALAAGILQCFWVPFALAPLALVSLVLAIMLSPKYRGLYEVAMVVIAIGVVIGGTVAVLGDNPLY